MRNFLLLLTGIVFLLSCNNKTKSKTTGADTSKVETSSTQSTTTVPAPSPSPLEKFLGSFVGPFGDNKITLLVIKVKDDSVLGRTIVGGNDRPFRGTYRKEDNKYVFSAKEPGDHKDDGEFNFAIDSDSPDMVTGSWKPFAPCTLN